MLSRTFQPSLYTSKARRDFAFQNGCLAALCYSHVMARIVDHPLRLARLQAKLSQQALAKAAGVNRSAVSAVEDGRTRLPSDRFLAAVCPLLGVAEDDLRASIEAWLTKPSSVSLRVSAQNVLAIPPYVLPQYYRSFRQWRSDVSPSPTAFASLLRMNPSIVRDYEDGKLLRMPDTFASRLLATFSPYGFSEDYLVALEGLERS